MENFISNEASGIEYPTHENHTPPFWLPLADRKLFCAFETVFNADKNKYIKYPKATNGKVGIKKVEKDLLDTCANVDEILQGKGSNWKLGFGFLEPIEVEGKYLVCVDVDLDADACDDAVARTEKIRKALLKTGAYYEESVSGRGCHFFLLCDKNQVPPTYNSNAGWKIEVFSGFKDHSKLVCLTGNNAQGKLVEVNLSLLFSQQGIGPIKEPVASKSTTINIDASQYYDRVDVASLNKLKADIHEVKKAISFIPSDDYDHWIKVGMALSNEYGPDGFKHWDYWSSSSDKYQPEEMNAKWSSFNGSGIGIGTLFMLAQSYGYKPSHQKNDAIDVFGPYLIDGTDPETGEIPSKEKNTIENRRFMPTGELQPIDWVIDNLIPAGVGSIPGYSGVGKTTVLIPLALIAAGFVSHRDHITASVRRKVVIFTEDTNQIDRILHGVIRHMKLKDPINGKENVTMDDVLDWVAIYSSRRLTVKELEVDAIEAISTHTIPHAILGDVAPLIVFDTAAANLKVEQENDNAEISNNMGKLKEMHERFKAHCWVINHFSKDAKNKSIDDLLSMSARGGSAWGSDANWDCVIGKANADDPHSKTILKIGKERTGMLHGKEIQFEVTQHSVLVTTPLDETQEIYYPVVSIFVENSSVRRAQAANERADKALKAKAMDLYSVLIEYPDGLAIKAISQLNVKGLTDKNTVKNAAIAGVGYGMFTTEEQPPIGKREPVTYYIPNPNWKP